MSLFKKKSVDDLMEDVKAEENNETNKQEVVKEEKESKSTEESSNTDKDSKRTLKINKLIKTEIEREQEFNFNTFEEGFVDDITGFNFTLNSKNQLDDERKEKFNMTQATMYEDLERRKKEDIKNIGENVGTDYIESAVKDLKLVYSKIKELIPFTAETYKSILNQAIRKIEKIIASEENFYRMEVSERSKFFEDELSKRLPKVILEDFSFFFNSEFKNPFGVYREVYDEIRAQDFILTANFINIQYDNENFFYIDIPDYLIEINNIIISHMLTIYSYSKNFKFGPKNAMIDLEDQGFRFNLEHGSIVSTGYPVLFARKNTFGVAKLIENPNYYKDLFSNSHKTDNEIDEMITKMRDMADKGNFLVVGRTGSGKTTLLRQLLLDRPSREQNLITIEDTKELNLPNAISYLTNKDYSISDIFKSTLRMNPSRVIVGETRDRTILDILEVCLTSKSATTLHATDLPKAITRIRMMSKGEISTEDLDFLIASAIDMFIFIDNRKISGLYIKDDNYKISNDIFSTYHKFL